MVAIAKSCMSDTRVLCMNKASVDPERKWAIIEHSHGRIMQMHNAAEGPEGCLSCQSSPRPILKMAFPHKKMLASCHLQLPSPTPTPQPASCPRLQLPLCGSQIIHVQRASRWFMRWCPFQPFKFALVSALKLAKWTPYSRHSSWCVPSSRLHASLQFAYRRRTWMRLTAD